MKAEDREVLKAAVISLLSLARPFGCEISEETRTMSLLDDDEDDEEFSFDDYLMASRYGVWLLEGLFKPKPEDDARYRPYKLYTRKNKRLFSNNNLSGR